MAKSLVVSGLMGALLTLAGAALAADLPPACDSHAAAVTGGPLPPPDSDTIVIRWLGNANFEFAHKGKVYLFAKIRAEMPGTAFLAPLYRSPICVAGAGPDKGKVVSFRYAWCRPSIGIKPNS